VDAVRRAERDRIKRALFAHLDPRTRTLTLSEEALHLILGGC
jgi:hypothetical protein